MKITTVSGEEMLTMCNRADKIREVKETVVFTLIDHKDQSLYIEGIATACINPVVIVNKNADFTEGRGPMHFHKAFKTLEKAIDYIMTQDGIYGSKQGVSNYAGVSIYGKPYVVSTFNGYNIEFAKIE